VTPLRPGSARRGWLAAVLAGGAAACLAAGAHLLTEPARAEVADAGVVPGEADAGVSRAAPRASFQAPARPRVQEVPPRRVVTTRVRPRPMASPPLALPPVTLAAPALDARARIVPVGTDATGALDLPEDPRTLGWWVGGALPGASRGTAVLAGHVDTESQGAGIMARVARLPVGAGLTLIDAGGRAHPYTVAAVRSYPKTSLPAALFTASDTARLVLVTCGGAFDAARHHYSDNIVVYAVPARP
jgi:hypothetical protein